MKKPAVLRSAIITLLVLALASLPVSGMIYQPTQTSVSAANTAVPASTATGYVSATVSSGTPVVGDPVTISGTVTGTSIPAGVRIWVFAGNYVNVSDTPVNAGGSFSQVYSTSGLPPAKYYVLVQSPGANEKYNIELEEAGLNYAQVINAVTNKTIFNITGAEGVMNANALLALSEAIDDQGVDDAYTKLTFQLIAPVTTSSTAVPQTSAIPVTAITTQKSPLVPEITVMALMIGGICCGLLYRKRD
jgi:hypothetical protein